MAKARKGKASRKPRSPSVQKRLQVLAGRVPAKFRLKKGVLALRQTGKGGGDWHVRNTARGVQVGRGRRPESPLVEVIGDGPRIRAVLSGREDAAKAFVRGGIRVRGDVRYLERLLKALGLLRCV